MMSKPVEHEITLLAFDANGQVEDAVWTSRHYASHFARRWRRDTKIASMAAIAPGVPIAGCASLKRELRPA